MLKELARYGFALAVAVCLLVPSLGSADSNVSTVTITATVDSFAEWDVTSPAIEASDFDGHITSVDQAITALQTLTLYANVNTTITPTGGVNVGILSSETDTLTTSYKMSGDEIEDDAEWIVAGTGTGEFFAANTYSVTHEDGVGAYEVTLHVRAEGPGDRAPDAGDYTCGVVLTASWD